MKIALVFGVIARSNDADVVGVGPHHVPAEILERVIELVDRAAIELLRGDELVARLHQRSASRSPARRGRRRPQGPRCRLRARRRAPPAPRWSDCRCAYRCCRRPAGRTARRRDRRRRTRTTWSDRSASRARRWSDRAGRRRGWRASKSPECVRSWWPILVLPGAIAAACVVYRTASGRQGDVARRCANAQPPRASRGATEIVAQRPEERRSAPWTVVARDAVGELTARHDAAGRMRSMIRPPRVTVG